MTKTTYIYKFIHPNTKDIVYIGKSSAYINGRKTRIYTHFSIALHSNKKTRFYDWLRSKIKQYGKRTIKKCFIIIRENLSDEEACILEKSLIRKYKRIEQGGKLLNHMVGGNGGAMDLESRKKLSLTKTGKKHKSNCNCPFCKDKTGRNNPFFGKLHTETTRIKMRKPKPSIQGGNHCRARAVILYDKDFKKIKEFATVNEAIAKTGCTKSSILHKCVKKNKSRTGINWRYKYEKMS